MSGSTAKATRRDIRRANDKKPYISLDVLEDPAVIWSPSGRFFWRESGNVRYDAQLAESRRDSILVTNPQVIAPDYLA